MINESFNELLELYLAGTIPEAGLIRLASMLETPEGQWHLAALIDASFANIDSPTVAFQPDSEAIFRKIHASLPPAKVLSLHHKKRMSGWMTAAAAILAIAAGVWLFILPNAKNPPKTQATLGLDVPAPATARATIFLSNGKRIALDTMHSTVSEPEEDVSIDKNAEGAIVYNPVANNNRILYNTLMNPRGSKVVSITLSDGTRVWLNAESSMKYPTMFPKGERRVEITGEAYFEVKHDATKPFIVTGGQSETTVLGTSFNVNAYDDEGGIKIALLEGSIRADLDHHRQSILLKPGQQATVSGGQWKIDNPADMEQTVAWKDGWFEFDNLDLPAILRQLSRWYDVDIDYKANLTAEKFGGRISRNLPLSDVLHSLAGTKATFTLQGRTLIVQ